MNNALVPWALNRQSSFGPAVVAMACAVVDSACQSISLRTTKSADYQGRVERLAVLYLARPQVDVEATGTGAFVKPLQEEAQRWLKVGEFDQFVGALGEAIPKAFEKHGVPASFERSERLPNTFDGYTGKQVLVIDPFMVMVGTISGGAYVFGDISDGKPNDTSRLTNAPLGFYDVSRRITGISIPNDDGPQITPLELTMPFALTQ